MTRDEFADEAAAVALRLLDTYLGKDRGPRLIAIPCLEGWYIAADGERWGTLLKSNGWTRTLIDEMIRLFNEGLPPV